jgi:serine protease Do
MKKAVIKNGALALGFAVLAPLSLLAQKDEKEKKEVRQVIITSKGDKEVKVTVEINGDKITINGKPVDEYKDGDVKVNLHKLKDIDAITTYSRGGLLNLNGDGFGGRYRVVDDRAMLGVTTEKNDKGVGISNITEESAAEKMGLKEGDIITKIDDQKIETPDDVSAAIKKHKPGDKVTVTYTREGKENKVSGELTKWKGPQALAMTIPDQNFNFNFDEMGKDFPRGFTAPRVQGQNWAWGGGSPKLGLSVQDTDDGKGVKVIEVDEESNAAKAGIKEDDIITHVDDKGVNGVDEISKLLREKKESPAVRFQLTRNGKSQNIEVKMPRKIKTADL